MEVLVIKRLDGSLIPAYDSDKDKLSKIKLNEALQVTIKKPRNVMFHRKFFALLNLVFNNQDIYNNIEHLRHDLTVEAGYFEEVRTLHGEVTFRAKSISFASMDEHEFSELYGKIVIAVCKWLKIEKQDIIDNIDQYF